jgi:hypothetical protein
MGRSAMSARYPGHGWGNATVQPDPQHPTLGPVGRHVSHTQAEPIRNHLRIRARLPLLNAEKVWGTPGVETPVTPDGPDVLDGGDVVELRCW